MRDVQITLIMSVVLVVAVIFLFLRSPRATFIPAIALPLSLVGTFGVMQQLGYALDNLSLMALTIATGFVVDDAIVMIENIVRYIEQGMRPLAAAYRGAAQIGFTIVSLTVSLIAVFIPLLFMGGVVGTAVQGVLRHPVGRRGGLGGGLADADADDVRPHPAPRAATNAPAASPASARPASTRCSPAIGAAWPGHSATRRWCCWSASATLVGTIWLYVVVPKGFLPQQDTGVLVAVTEAAQSVSIPRLVALQTQVARDRRARSGGDRRGVVRRRRHDQRHAQHRAADHRAEADQPARSGAGGDRAHAAGDRRHRRHHGVLPAGAGHPDRHAHQPHAVPVHADGHRSGGTGAVGAAAAAAAGRRSRRWRTSPPISRTTASAPTSTSTATRRCGSACRCRRSQDTLYDAFGQRQISTIFGQANQYRVVLEADPSWQADPNSLRLLRVPGTNGAQVPLSGIATITRTVAPLVVTHQEQFPSVTLSFDLAPGYSLGNAVRAIAAAEQEIGMPETISGSYSGDAAEFQKSLAAEPWLILAALVVIYIVLGVLYESWIHPITILSTLPSAGIGALLALMLCGIDLSLVALVGIVLLMGIVKKNAIMMVDFAIEAERTRGVSPEDAIREACLLRFRPIMMTTMAALLGALPLVLERGAGSELRSPLGVTIIGGLLLSQFLTLYTTPAIYLAFERLRQRFSRASREPAE